MHDLTLLDITLRLGMALLFGAMVGWEREQSKRPAGLRTNMLVALGAASFTLVSIAMIQQYLINHPEPVAIDPAKIIAGIVGGIGFLGAGAIFQHSDKVQGMTTAAGIWVVAAVGVASGAGYYIIAGVCVGFAVFTLVIIRWVEGHMETSDKKKTDAQQE
jgi:putative Mg2+ transporter-C (MgtC) family protein